MKQIINIYCDESCHLPNDGQKSMVLGALWCLKDDTKKHNNTILKAKTDHKLNDPKRKYEHRI